MKVAMMQPAFLPWQGFFALVMEADTFIFLDDFQFSIQSYHQRNKLLVNQDSADWYTVPVKKKEAFKKPQTEVFPNNTQDWVTKITKRIQQNYGKSPFYEQVTQTVLPLIQPHLSLAEINMGVITAIAKMLGHTKTFRKSSEIKATGERTTKVINLLEAVAASAYLSAAGAFNYMKDDGYRSMTDISVSFLNYTPKEYPQQKTKTFISHLSTLDALFNIGPKETAALIKESTTWLSWEAFEDIHNE